LFLPRQFQTGHDSIRDVFFYQIVEAAYIFSYLV
jgi:hypothetical protein